LSGHQRMSACILRISCRARRAPLWCLWRGAMAAHRHAFEWAHSLCKIMGPGRATLLVKVPLFTNPKEKRELIGLDEPDDPCIPASCSSPSGLHRCFKHEGATGQALAGLQVGRSFRERKLVQGRWLSERYEESHCVLRAAVTLRALCCCLLATCNLQGGEDGGRQGRHERSPGGAAGDRSDAPAEGCWCRRATVEAGQRRCDVWTALTAPQVLDGCERVPRSHPAGHTLQVTPCFCGRQGHTLQVTPCFCGRPAASIWSSLACPSQTGRTTLAGEGGSRAHVRMSCILVSRACVCMSCIRTFCALACACHAYAHLRQVAAKMGPSQETCVGRQHNATWHVHGLAVALALLATDAGGLLCKWLCQWLCSVCKE